MSQPPPNPKYVPCACGSHDAYWHGPEYACDPCWNALRFRATGLVITGKCRDGATGRVSVTVALASPSAIASGDMSPDDQVSEILDRLHRLAAAAADHE